MNILFLDTETTGLNPDEHQIIQLSARFDVDGKNIDNFNRRIRMGGTVDLGALAVNGRNLSLLSVPAELNTPEYDVTHVVKQFIDWSVNIYKKYNGFVASGHNLHFDMTFLKAACKRLNLTGFDNLFGHRYLDTAAIGLFLKDKGLLPLEKIDIKSLIEYFGIDNKGLHDSMFDVEASADIYYAMLEL